MNDQANPVGRGNRATPDGITVTHLFLEILEDGPDPIQIRSVAHHRDSESGNIVAVGARKFACRRMIPCKQKIYY
jgi:hypothetical protein